LLQRVSIELKAHKHFPLCSVLYLEVVSTVLCIYRL